MSELKIVWLVYSHQQEPSSIELKGVFDSIESVKKRFNVEWKTEFKESTLLTFDDEQSGTYLYTRCEQLQS